MLCYITCTCGSSLGDIHRLYREMKSDMLKEKGIDVKAINLPITSEEDQISINPIFDLIGLKDKDECCRMKLMSVAEFLEYL